MSVTVVPANPLPRRTASLTWPIIGACGAVVLMVVGAILASLRDQPLPTLYGRRRGSDTSVSVNGTAVLAEMFRRAGNRVLTMRRFSPKLNEADVIVWIPDDFRPPSEDRREWLEQWLRDGSGRTLVYVGRDYNAAIDYWQQIVPQTPPAQANEAVHRQAEARAEWEAERSKMPTHAYGRWFTAKRDSPPRSVTGLAGPWAAGVDASQTRVHLEGLLAMPTYDDLSTLDDPSPPESIEPLLMAGEDAVAFQFSMPAKKKGDDDGQIIVVANGSFLLNYPLVNHEHRKLAARLIEACCPASKGPSKRVVFIESESGGPQILKKEPSGGFPTPLELLKVWPLNAILLHLTLLGIVVCLSRSLIFGRPRELAPDSPADFGKHVAALGKLLAQTKDRNYAQARLIQYRQIAERRSGRSHLK